MTNCDILLQAVDGWPAGAYAQIWCAGHHHIMRSLTPQFPALIDGRVVNWARLDDGEIEISRRRVSFDMIEPKDEVPEYLATNENTVLR